jgi:hypothetical protein
VAPCWCRRLPKGFFLSVPVCKMRCARKLLRRLRDSFPRRSIAEQRRAMHAAEGQGKAISVRSESGRRQQALR